MNYVYVDPSASVNGSGTLASPYNSMDAFIAAGWTHPVTVSVKRGTTFAWSYLTQTTAAFFCNQSGTQSVLTSYGDGDYPVWYPTGSTVRHTDTIFQNFLIEKFQLSPTPAQPFTGGYLYGWIKGDTNGLCNLEIRDIRFIGHPASIGGSAGKKEVSCIHLMADYISRTNIAHKIFIHDIYGDHVNCGIFVRGNPHLSDTITYYGDQQKSYGVRVLDVAFTNIQNYGVMLCGATSKNKNRDIRNDEWESGFDGVYYSSYHTNVYDAASDPNGYTTARADVPLWITMCSYVTGQNFEVHGSGPASPDRQSLDFDYHTNNCVFRYGYCTNNARGPMFIQGPFSNSWYSSNGYTAPSSDNYTMYYTLGVGCVSNVFEYITFYNDGIARTQKTTDLFWLKPQAYRYCYNNVVRNCLFIDTVSTSNDRIIGINPQTDDSTTAMSMTIDSCIFYWKCRDNTDLIGSAYVTSFGTLIAKFGITNSVVFSEAWASGSPATISNVTQSGLKFVDPKFKYTVPRVPPAGMKEAMNILQLASNSPCLATGTPTSELDGWGKAGNNIGWQQ